uniref:Flavin-containing monooxygenase n=3 Tax=Ciona intestinalis TaxID=7719 RepID=H2XSI9_CIOIN
MLPKRVCVIGAGPAGLAATKSCLDNQLVPVCYELCSGLGGTWNNKERIRMKLSPKVYESLITNLSKEASAFSDFPMPKEWPPYQEWRQYLRYFELYADKFDLKRYIEFDVAVLEVHKSLSYSQTGSWIVRSKSLINGNEKEIEFDAVIVASGGKTKQKWPEYSGLKDRFRGKVLHSGNYESAEEFKGKAVLICGAGNSGCDIAVNCSSVASNVLLST